MTKTNEKYNATYSIPKINLPNNQLKKSKFQNEMPRIFPRIDFIVRNTKKQHNAEIKIKQPEIIKNHAVINVRIDTTTNESLPSTESTEVATHPTTQNISEPLAYTLAANKSDHIESLTNESLPSTESTEVATFTFTQNISEPLAYMLAANKSDTYETTTVKSPSYIMDFQGYDSSIKEEIDTQLFKWFGIASCIVIAVVLVFLLALLAHKRLPICYRHTYKLVPPTIYSNPSSGIKKSLV